MFFSNGELEAQVEENMRIGKTSFVDSNEIIIENKTVLLKLIEWNANGEINNERKDKKIN